MFFYFFQLFNLPLLLILPFFALSPFAYATSIGNNPLTEICNAKYGELINSQAKKLEIGHLPGPESYKLPFEFIDLMNQHSIAQLRSAHGDGGKLTFAIQYYDPDKPQIGQHFGESIQAQFLSKTVKALFPQSQFENAAPFFTRFGGADRQKVWRQNNPDRQLVVLKIHDSAEVGLEAGAHDQVQMPIIKPANPGMAEIPHGSYRAGLGIPSDRYVVSLYMKDINGGAEQNHRPSARALISELQKVKSPQIIFLSHGGSSKVDMPNLSEYSSLGYELHNLSALDHVDLSHGKHIFINDLSGKMPYLYNVSDLAVVVGPINLFEPLSSRTKTLFFDNPEVLGQYHPQAFSRMKAQAIASGGGFAAKDLREFSALLKPVIESKQPIIPPYLKSADLFLSHLQDILKNTLPP